MDAGNALAYWKMQEPDAFTIVSTRRRIRTDSRVPVPAELAIPLRANLGNVFPRRTPFGRASAVRFV